MMANPLLFWAWSAPGSFWAWRALVAIFWPGVPWLIFGLECLGSFWRPGEPLVEFFRPGVPLVCFGLECLVSFLAWSAPGYAVANGELMTLTLYFGMWVSLALLVMCGILALLRRSYCSI